MVALSNESVYDVSPVTVGSIDGSVNSLGATDGNSSSQPISFAPSLSNVDETHTPTLRLGISSTQVSFGYALHASHDVQCCKRDSAQIQSVSMLQFPASIESLHVRGETQSESRTHESNVYPSVTGSGVGKGASTVTTGTSDVVAIVSGVTVSKSDADGSTPGVFVPISVVGIGISDGTVGVSDPDGSISGVQGRLLGTGVGKSGNGVDPSGVCGGMSKEIVGAPDRDGIASYEYPTRGEGDSGGRGVTHGNESHPISTRIPS